MTSRPWRLLFTGTSDGARNMALDEAILKSVEAGQSPPTLRIYGWNPFCVTLGYFQNPAVELDGDALRTRGWDFALRSTGGRAVLHAEEITYSIAAGIDEEPWCRTLALSHAHISRAWSEALRSFDLDLAKAESGERPVRGEVNLPCFASVSKSELMHQGRKVVGSAQRRARRAFLQHGSIPLTREYERLVEVLRLSEPERQTQLRVLRGHAISLGEIGSLPSDIEAWSRRLAVAVGRALGVDAAEGALSSEEESRAREIETAHRRRTREFFGASIPSDQHA